MNDDGAVVMIVGPTTSIAPVAGPMTGEVIIPAPPQQAPRPAGPWREARKRGQRGKPGKHRDGGARGRRRGGDGGRTQGGRNRQKTRSRRLHGTWSFPGRRGRPG